MPQVQKIACTNNAGFDMYFSILWEDENGVIQDTDWKSDTYPIDQTRVSPDLATIGISPDARSLTPHVHAIFGKRESGTTVVTYAENDQTATYEVKGTTQRYSVNLIE